MVGPLNYPRDIVSKNACTQEWVSDPLFGSFPEAKTGSRPRFFIIVSYKNLDNLSNIKVKKNLLFVNLSVSTYEKN